MNKKEAYTIIVVVLLIVVGFLIYNSYISIEQTPLDEEKTYCTPESRNVDVCVEIYQPVCGWFNPEKIQCIKYPCAEIYSNGCGACANENVLYWTEGECPSG